MERASTAAGADRRAAYLVGLLARAMTVQVDELVRAGSAAPDGWWFREPHRDLRHGTVAGESR